ncbi:putative modular polyketide synthase [Actinacidiphila reveromycinica]|uniref:Putative modular polyketide synthase n=1 Tax=Actinacidiphila reveromycinica TaxID=659352 RepID=A0A7U3UMR2_9ACTN|nr:type I polyketide synthase [Streptomyces sp. SN-593]BBA97110.1 putative modular polyketide synthase [Streptomyces sp. SN-593]
MTESPTAGGPDIAVVGIACRLPGASTPEELWDLLREGRDAIGRASERNRTTAPDGPDWPGGFIDDVDAFDAAFFGVSPNEAAAMDPQQRVMLELCWEALEDAGIVPADLAGGRAGVFAASIASDYATLMARQQGRLSRYTLTGLNRGIIANRVSYSLGLRGPSLTVDSAQSSSLVSVHLAAESIRRGEADLALAGGVNLMLDPGTTAMTEQFNALSPDGRCHTFDARANGFVRGEGGAVVVLKGADRARADGDRIYGLILGSAVNNDGLTDGLTVPSEQAQRDVIRDAVRAAGVRPDDVQYVELHGTGTKVGDPIEAAALGAALGTGRPADRPLRVGSLKTNIGHLEGASGVAGLLKVLLSIERRHVPASLNYEHPNPAIPLAELGLSVQAAQGPWPDEGRRLVAGVSSFGMGGTNCHLVVAEQPAGGPAGPAPADIPAEAPAEAPADVPADIPADVPADHIAAHSWPLSARTTPALRAQAARLRAHAASGPEVPTADTARALATTRQAFEQRAVVLGDDHAELRAGLHTLQAGDQAANVVEGTARAVGGTVFVFPGQGSQWPRMARDLLDTSPVFAEHLTACAEALSAYQDWSVLDVVRGAPGAPSLDRGDVVQPALFAVMVALARLWQAQGVAPAAVIGHSQGEIAAAHVAGALSLSDAAAVVALRGQALKAVAGLGGMVSVAEPVDAVRERIAGYTGLLGVGAVNGPGSTVVSGDPAALAELMSACRADGVRVREVPIDYASHSPQVDAIEQDLLRLLAPIRPRRADLAFYSTVTGGLLDTTELTAAYWFRNLRQTVEFEPAVRAALADGNRAFVETSPHPGLVGSIGETLRDADVSDALVTGTLRRGHGGLRQFLTSVAQYHVQGGALDWAPAPGTGRRVHLPTYAFQRERFWFGAATGNATAPAGTPLPLPAAPAPAGPRPAAGAPEDTAAGTAPRTEDLVGVVQKATAITLGHASPDAVDVSRTFKDLGLDSGAALELRGRLAAATGLELPDTLVFAHPTPDALARHLRAELDGGAASVQPAAQPSVSTEPLAIVGMACRYPGDADSPESLWDLVAGRRDAIGEFPANRGWDLAALYDPTRGRSGTSYTRNGGFLYDADEFDPDFFGISPREATAMDPQQRLLLETAWQALEDAGIDPGSLRGGQVGVFTGVMGQDYGPRLHEQADGYDGYLLTGNSPSVASGRVAYALGLQGPAVTVDTACSSSLVATHLAAQALRNGECSLALAGGATVMSTPGIFAEFSRQGGLAPDGRCKAYAAAADGTGWGEGAGVIAIERLSDARRNGHRVLAVLRGSAINQDGASNGLTAPNGSAQQRVIGQALAAAGLRPDEVDAVEGHGTGTKLGDPIEAEALLAAYGRGRDAESPLWLGSMKSNIGHTQAAAGVAGVIKMVQALRHEVLPATLHVDAPSGHVDWASGAVRLLTDARPWPAGERVRRAGVSSFGISGTNAHVILEEAPAGAEEPDQGAGGGCPAVPALVPVPVQVLVSAKDEAGLRAQAGRLREHLIARPGLGLADVGYSTATTRAHLEYRAAVSAADRDGLLASLAGLAVGDAGSGVVEGRAHTGKTVFVFPGQGAQWVGMAVGLLESSAVFAGEVAACDEELGRLVGWRVVDVLREVVGAPSLERVDVVQPVLFAVMVGLAAVWRSVGVEPDVVVGHSQGEIAAAYVAGGLSLGDAVRVVALRSRLVGERLAGLGGMVSVGLSVGEVEGWIGRFGGRVSVAAVNSPRSVVVSGEPGPLDELLEEWRQEGVRARKVPVDYASHSAQVGVMEGELLEVLAPLVPRAGRVPFYSTAVGGFVGTETLDGGYWYANLRGQVGFEEAVRSLAGQGVGAFLEMSPHPVLVSAVSETVQEVEGGDLVRVVGSLRRGEGGPGRFAMSLAEAHVAGVGVDWAAFYAGTGARRVDLPGYAFQRSRYWLPVRAGGGDLAGSGLARFGHPMLSAAVRVGDRDEWVFAGRVSQEAQPWTRDHAVFGMVIVPGAALAELSSAVGAHLDCPVVEELVLQVPLLLSEDGGLDLQVMVGAPDEDGRRDIAVYTAPGEGAGQEGVQPTCHARGKLGSEVESPAVRFPAQWPPQGGAAEPVEGLYERLAEAGYEYGPLFQGLRAAWRDGDRVYAELALPEEDAGSAQGFGIHPALLDAALHGSLMDARAGSQVGLPFAWSGIRTGQASGTRARVMITPAGDSAVRIDMVDDAGAVIAAVDSVAFRPVDQAQLERAQGGGQDSLFTVEWVPVRASEAAAAVPVAVLGDLAGAGERHADLGALTGAVAAGAAAPEVVVAAVGTASAAGGEAGAARAVAAGTLALVQEWLAADALSGARLVLVTRGAISTAGEVPDVAAAATWGLVRSAQSEHLDRFVLVDLDPAGDGGDAAGAAPDWAALAGLGESQVAVREGRTLAPRLARAGAPAVPAEGPWRLAPVAKGSLEGLKLVPSGADRPLEAGEVRVAVRAAGLNFRDVLIALGVYPGDAPLGSEAAGVVLETGADVTDLAPGDRVMGLVLESFGTVAVADRRMVAPVPDGWSYAQAAAVPIVYLTAYYGLVDLGGLAAGERVLVHAAAGGVGMAAVQLATHLGAEVYATASPAKWEAVRALGVPAERIANSRDLDFAETFARATDGKGVDMVLDALAGEFVDASLSLLPNGGRFLEMGKADIRDPREIAETHPGVRYRAFDLFEVDPERLGEMLGEVLDLFARGVLAHAPVRTWDVRRYAEAFRFLREGRNTGKVVLTVPGPLDADGAVLVTGGTGGLGALVARHLVTVNGARHLVLVSRRGPEAPGAAELAAELEDLGCRVRVAACDVTDRGQLADLLASLDVPLTGVVHAAGILDDGVVASLTPEQLDRVMRPKVDAALLLDELTADADLRSFVLFSSVAALIGNPGQGNYAAANAVLDALAARRRASGRPAVSLAWGLWETRTGMTGELGEADLTRLNRLGLQPLPTELGLELLDAAQRVDAALVAPVQLDLSSIRAQARQGMAPPLLAGLVRVQVRQSRTAAGGGGGSLASRLAQVGQEDWEQVTLDLVTAQVAAVLGHASGAAVDPARAFKELGFDSLSAVELRNRLTQATGLKLPTTLVFDHPTAIAVTRYMIPVAMPGAVPNGRRTSEEDEIRDVLTSIPIGRLRAAGLLDALLELVSNASDDGSPEEDSGSSIDEMDAAALIRMTEETAV